MSFAGAAAAAGVAADFEPGTAGADLSIVSVLRSFLLFAWRIDAMRSCLPGIVGTSSVAEGGPAAGGGPGGGGGPPEDGGGPGGGGGGPLEAGGGPGGGGMGRESDLDGVAGGRDERGGGGGPALDRDGTGGPPRLGIAGVARAGVAVFLVPSNGGGTLKTRCGRSSSIGILLGISGAYDGGSGTSADCREPRDGGGGGLFLERLTGGGGGTDLRLSDGSDDCTGGGKDRMGAVDALTGGGRLLTVLVGADA